MQLSVWVRTPFGSPSCARRMASSFAAAACPKFEVYTDKAGEFRFRLKAKNGQIIATSEGYKKKPSCLNGIESVKKNAPEASIETEAYGRQAREPKRLPADTA